MFKVNLFMNHSSHGKWGLRVNDVSCCWLCNHRCMFVSFFPLLLSVIFSHNWTIK